MKSSQLVPIILIIGASALIVAGLAFWYQSISAPAQSQSASVADIEALLQDGPLALEEIERISNDLINPMNPTATIATNRGLFVLELFEDAMPVTVGNFISLSESGFYNETKFHRIIDGFMIQAGDPNTRTDDVSTYGRGGPGYTIQDEFVEDQRLTNVRGTIAMANTGQPNSGGSQFFVNTVDNSNLDFNKQPLTSRHPVFGRVIEGMTVVDTISSVETGPGDLPVDPVVIESITINR